MNEGQRSSYEDVPYDSQPLYPTHPDCLATIGTLMGMRPAAVENCRVLELGCATGGNLIPMAATLPGSRFVGIDLSPSQIADGQSLVDALELANIELRAASILDVDETYGKFDYVICHGVYSWVPPAVQDKILAICASLLAEQGLAYISYNTFPGWHARSVIREMMGFHARHFADATAKVEQARAFLGFLANSVVEPDSPYGRMLREETNSMADKRDYYLYHEYLEDENRPLYFHQFAQRLTDHGLQFVGEAWHHTSDGDFPSDVQAKLTALADNLVHREQCIDFLVNRTFRRSLVCHHRVQLSRQPDLETVMQMQLTALVRPIHVPCDLSPGVEAAFVTDDDKQMSTNIPLVKAALAALFEAWPSPLSFGELWSLVADRLNLKNQPDSPSNRPAFLAECLLRCYLSHAVAFHVSPARPARQFADRPLASRLARYQAAGGRGVVNLRHRIVPLAPVERLVLAQLDGACDRQSLVHTVRSALADGRLDATEHLQRDASELVEASLRRLAQTALLVA